jgi:hypothetical protein
MRHRFPGFGCVYKNRWFGLDAEARNYLAFGGDRGAHYLFAPALAARIAF